MSRFYTSALLWVMLLGCPATLWADKDDDVSDADLKSLYEQMIPDCRGAIQSLQAI